MKRKNTNFSGKKLDSHSRKSDLHSHKSDLRNKSDLRISKERGVRPAKFVLQKQNLIPTNISRRDAKLTIPQKDLLTNLNITKRNGKRNGEFSLSKNNSLTPSTKTYYKTKNVSKNKKLLNISRLKGKNIKKYSKSTPYSNIFPDKSTDFACDKVSSKTLSIDDVKNISDRTNAPLSQVVYDTNKYNCLQDALNDVDDKFKAFIQKYNIVADEINAARKHREANAIENRRKRAYKFGGLCELSGGAAARWRRGNFYKDEEEYLYDSNDPDYFSYLAFMRKVSSIEIARLKAKVRRPHYYAAENARRQALAKERRKIYQRRTINACPTKEQILDAWIQRRRSHDDAIRFGSLIEDLECYIDNSLKRSIDGSIIGRNTGIKGWIRENIPILECRYTTVMRYKAAAKKLKQLTDLKDPTPVDIILDSNISGNSMDNLSVNKPLTPCLRQDIGSSIDNININTPKNKESENNISSKLKNNNNRTSETSKITAEKGITTRKELLLTYIPSVEIVRARAIWKEIEKGIGTTSAALFARLDALTNPENIEDSSMLESWKEKYKKKINEKTKTQWWFKRLAQKIIG